jgi:hypothetical protein
MRKWTASSNVDKVDQTRRLYLSLKNEKKEITSRNIFKKKWNFFSKNCSLVTLYFQNCLSLHERTKEEKRENSERFSVTQANFDNDVSLDVELMKENLTSSLEIDKIKWVLSFLSLPFSHFLDYRNKRLFFNPVRCTAGG